MRGTNVIGNLYFSFNILSLQIDSCYFLILNRVVYCNIWSVHTDRDAIASANVDMRPIGSWWGVVTLFIGTPWRGVDFRIHFIILLSYSAHTPLILLSYSSHTPLILLSYSSHTPRILLSYSSHSPLILLSYSYHQNTKHFLLKNVSSQKTFSAKKRFLTIDFQTICIFFMKGLSEGNIYLMKRFVRKLFV